MRLAILFLGGLSQTIALAAAPSLQAAPPKAMGPGGET
jgi:hypothetical protein